MSGIARRRLLVIFLFAALSIPAGAGADGRSTLTFHNRSGEHALVRLAGPTSGFVEVPDESSRTIGIAGGFYHLYVRYGSPGRYSYTRGEPFTVTETARGYESVEITLHVVVGGNYGTQPSNEAEFSNGR